MAKKPNKDGTIRWVCSFKGCNGSITSYNGIAVKLNGVAVVDIDITEMVDSHKDKHAPYSDEQLVVKEEMQKAKVVVTGSGKPPQQVYTDIVRQIVKEPITI